MTKKDYILIAKAIHETVDYLLNNKNVEGDIMIRSDEALMDTISRAAKALEDTQPRFDSYKFLEACGYWEISK